MGVLEVLRTEFRRQWFPHLALMLASAVVGISFAVALRVQAHIREALNPPSWGATVALLPKGVTLDSLLEDLKQGQARALLPKALFETIKGQVADEMARKHLTAPSLQLFAVVAGKNAEGRPVVRTLGNFPVDEAPWRGFKVEEWHPTSDTQTKEWGQDVIEAIFAVGGGEAATNLKALADRRTVAQGVMIAEEIASDETKAARISDQVWIAVGLVLICGILIFLLSLRLTIQQRRNLFEVLKILGWPRGRLAWVVTLQAVIFLVIPAAVGIGLVALY